MNKEKEKLFSEFSPVSTENWKNKIIEDLKGADYEKKMVWRTGEGFNVNPFYRKEDLPAGYDSCAPGEYPYTRGNKKCNCWLIRQDINIEDVNFFCCRIGDFSSKCLLALDRVVG